ncbi:hypothetical protein QRD02_11760 [Aequorivita sp. SDUM287046]|uniref:Uncharacterized protein n=1 Tax=Aequorivita aurantiaca TaxID=3053356 RepID=A0ABT8DPR7_9FLAO|nr:hypothetical protein [Aequorivita aurantiaca]MDN3725062.1 hypothetical protein [Aequorivita aurantiaca]
MKTKQRFPASKKSIFIFGLLLLFFAPITMFAQKFDGLTPLENYKTKTYYSSGSKEAATAMAERCDRVLEFYKDILDFEPDVNLLVLSPEDWSKYTNFPVYGMPHYNDNKTLIVASEDNEFWKSFIPPVNSLPETLAQEIIATYKDANGTLSMKAFFDLLAIHELGHAFHIQGGLKMQRKWMGELFANILLHTYIAENEPELLPALTVFPKMVVSSTDKASLKYTSLLELENNYEELGQKYPQNYGWYQCRWHIAAGKIYDEGGTLAIKKLWSALKTQQEPLDDAAFIKMLSENTHQCIADVPLKWDE